MAEVGDQTAVGADHPRVAGDHRAPQADLGHQLAGVQRPRPPEGHGREPGRVQPPLHRDQPDGAGHGAGGHLDHRLGRLLHPQPQRPAHPFGHRGPGGGRVQGVEPADGCLAVDAAQHQMGVGDGGPVAARPVAGRARHRAGRLRSHPQPPARVHPGDGAAPGPDGGDLDHRGPYHQPEVDGGLGAGHGAPGVHHGHVEAGAAHVAGDHVVVARRPGQIGAGDHPRGRAAQGGPHRQRPGRGRGHHPAVGLDQEEASGEAPLGQRRLQVGQVAAHHRLQPGVQGHGGDALELADLGQDVRRGGHVPVGPDLPHRLQRRLLVGRVGVGVQEGHAAGLGPGLQQGPGPLGRLAGIDLRQHRPVGQHPLGHLQAAVPGDDRLEVAPQPPGAGPVASAHLQHVPEPLRGDQPDRGQLALEQGVGAHGGAVDDDGRRGEAALRPGPVQPSEQPGHEAVGLPPPGGGRLGHPDLAGALVQDADVGEGAPHVDARHHPARSARFVHSARPGRSGRRAPGRGFAGHAVPGRPAAGSPAAEPVAELPSPGAANSSGSMP